MNSRQSLIHGRVFGAEWKWEWGFIQVEGELDTSDLAIVKKIFPLVKEFTLVGVLEKSLAGVDGTVDELLNEFFLDGFSVEKGDDDNYGERGSLREVGESWCGGAVE